MKFNVSPFAGAVVALLCGLPLAAYSIDRDSPVLVITPSKTLQPMHEVGSSIVRLNGHELREQGIEFVADALHTVPSLLVSSQGARGSQVQVRARGNEANHVLVLIDGVRVSNASTGEFDFASLSMEAIDNIEILLGPQSTLYGSDAIGGVINITTKKGQGDLGGNIGFRLGERDIRSVSAGVNGANEGFHYAVTVEDFATDGISSASKRNGNDELDPFEKQALNIKFGYQGDQVSSNLTVSQNEASFDFDGDDSVTGLAQDETANNQIQETGHISLQIRIPALESPVTHEFQLSRANNDYQTVSVFFGSDSEYYTETDRNQFEYRGHWQVNNQQSLQFGYEEIEDSLKTESISSFGASTFDEDVQESGLYVNWLYQHGAMNLSVGTRLTDHEEFGSHSTSRVTASYQVSEQIRYKAAYGTGYKTPSLQELFDGSFGGNTDLQPEESDSAEIGLEFTRKDYLLALTYFDQDTSNLIRYEGSYPMGINENVGEASSHGLELTMRKRWNWFDLDAAISRTRASEVNNDVRDERIRVPKWSANVQGNYRYASGRVWLQVQYRDERRDWQFTTPRQEVTLDSYTLWNVGVNHRVKKDLTLSARVDNLTNEDYEEVFSYGTRGRTTSVAANWVF